MHRQGLCGRAPSRRLDCMSQDIFTKDFKARPFWWEAHEPKPLPEIDLPRETRVAIIGAGYAGLNAALELEGAGARLHRARRQRTGLRRVDAAMAAWCRAASMSASATWPRPLSAEEAAPFLNDAADAFSHIEDLIAREKIDCGWTRAGYFLGAWCKSHYDGMAQKVDMLNQSARSEAYLVPPERQREEIGSDYYRGGMVVGRAGHLHPALFFKGLLDLCQKRGIAIASKTPATKLTETGTGWRGRNAARHHRGGRRDHRHQWLYRRRDAAAQAPRRAGRLLHHRHGRTGARDRRVDQPEEPFLRRYAPRADLLPHVARRQAPDLRRPRQVRPYRSGRDGADPARLHAGPLSAAEGHEDHPCLDRQRGLHAGRDAAHGQASRTCTMRWAATAPASP